MPRNDDILDTGLSSAQERRVAAKQAERARERRDRQLALTPTGEIVTQWINTELDAMKDMTKMAIDLKPDELREVIPLARRLNVSDAQLLQAQMMAQQMHIEFLKALKNRSKNILRQAKVAEKKADEDAPQAWKDAAASMEDK